MPLAYMAIAMGGHVRVRVWLRASARARARVSQGAQLRVGLEDNN